MLKRILLALFALHVIASPSSAQTLRFVSRPLPPLVIDRDGKPDGAVLQVLRELTENLGVPFEVTFLPQKRALLEPLENDNVAFAGLARNAERETQYKWVGPLVYDSIVLMTKKGIKVAPATLDAAKDWQVGVLGGGATIAMLQKAGFSNIQEKRDGETAALMLNAGRIDAWAGSKLAGIYLFSTLNFDQNTLDIGPEIGQNNVYLGVSKNVPDEMIATWQKALDELKASGRIDEITRRVVTNSVK